MTASLQALDWLLILAYFALLVLLSWRKRWLTDNEESYLLDGRKISLPAFVATLVSTWYGGILGVGEFSFQFGVSQWFIQAAPFYIFAGLFALLLAGKIRMNKALTIPEAIADRYSETAGRISAIPIFILVSPAPYILMLGLLFQFMTGGDSPYIFYAVLVALFSVCYVTIGGFGAVVRTDKLQVVLMFAGFITLMIYAASEFGSPAHLWQALPESHRDPTGGHTLQYILVWFFIALWTFVDPGFHQRCAAARSPETARKGIFVSILFWTGFDFLTTFCGLYGLAILGSGLEEPILVYPVLAETLLPVGLKGLFFITLLATMMSTLDSFLFLSGQTLGRDFLSRFYPDVKRNRLTKVGIITAALLGIALTIIYPSVIDLWYVLGSVFIPGLLIPVLGIYLPVFRLKSAHVLTILIGSTGLSMCWLALGTWFQTEAYSYAFLGVEPFYPGLFLSILIWSAGRLSVRNGLRRPT